MKTFALFTLLVASLRLNAQAVQVVTKVVEKTIPCPDGLTQRIHLNARKADVQVRGWNRSTVSVRLRLVAKHPDRAVAEREVAYHQYTLQANGSVIDLANSFVIPQRAGKLQSQLKAIYEVSVPNRAVLTLSNSFGDVDLRDLAGETMVTFEYGKMLLERLTGKLTIQSDYGDVEGKNLNATLVCKAEKSTVIFREHGGSSRIQSRYGELLSIFPDANKLEKLTVMAERTDVALLPINVDDFAYRLETIGGSLSLPDPDLIDFRTIKKDRQLLEYQTPGHKSLIEITSKNSPIHLFIYSFSSVGNK